MKMWLMEGESCGVGDYQSTWRRYVLRKSATGYKPDSGASVADERRRCASGACFGHQCAVRSRQEAAQVRDALTLLEIPPFTFRTATVFLKLWKHRRCLAVAGGDDART